MNITTVVNHINTSQQNIGIVLSKDSVDILQRLKKIDSSYFFYSDKKLVNKLKVIDPLELTNILKCFFMEMLREDRIKDPVKFLDRLTTMIPLTKLEEAVKDDVSGALEKANEMFAEAKLYLQMTQENYLPNFRAYFSSIIDGIMSVIESIIITFGIGDVFKPAESEMQASSKAQKIMMLFSYISMFAAIIPVIGAAASGLIISGTLLIISALSIIWPSIKPKTTHLPANAENWTKQIQAGAFVGQGRKESLDQIANILKINRHAILVGPSRVGKSLTAKAFAQAIARGDYPELNGKVVFRINTTELLGQPIIFDGEDSILNKISKTMGRHRDDIILVLDEIHMACKNNEKIADQLKTLLDEGGEFPHVIGITTEEEYSMHVKDNNAFSLRFDKVDIKNTSQDETLRILGETLLKSSSKPIIKEGVIDYIYDKSCEIENAPQPATAIKLLKRCINRTEKTQLSHTEQKSLRFQIKFFHCVLDRLQVIREKTMQQCR